MRKGVQMALLVVAFSLFPLLFDAPADPANLHLVSMRAPATAAPRWPAADVHAALTAPAPFKDGSVTSLPGANKAPPIAPSIAAAAPGAMPSASGAWRWAALAVAALLLGRVALLPDPRRPVAPWAMAVVNPELADLDKAVSQAFKQGTRRGYTASTGELIRRFEQEAFRQSFAAYAGTFLLASATGFAIYPILRAGLESLDPAIADLNVNDIGQPMAVVITTIAVTFGDLLSTTLGFGFDRLQAIRQSYYQEAAQLGILTNDLLLIFHDLPNEREAAIRRLHRHARLIYFTTDEARNDPKNNLSYVYIPGATSPFDDPLLRLIRQVSTFSGNLRNRDAFLDRILDRIDSSCRSLSARRDERISWELSRPPSAMYFSLLSLSTVFFMAYILLTINLTWPGLQLFFAVICGALALLYLVLFDLSDVQRGAFTVNSGLRGEYGTAPIMKPALDCIKFFLEEAQEECRKKGIPLKQPGEF